MVHTQPSYLNSSGVASTSSHAQPLGLNTISQQVGRSSHGAGGLLPLPTILFWEKGISLTINIIVIN